MKKTVIIMLIFIGIAHSQQKYKIYGHINDNKNKAIEGALIEIKELNIKILSNNFGHYEMYVLPGNYTLIYSFIGMSLEKKIIIITDKDYHLDIKMREDLLGLDQVVLSSSSTPISKKGSINNINILNSEIFYKTNSSTLFDGLKFQPGLRTFRTCHNCNSSEISINGLPSVYSQILIDGRPIFSGVSSIYGLEQIPSDIIERVEVTKGGGSIYSPYSIAGTLNIITKKNIDNRYSANANFGLIEGITPDINSNFSTSFISDDKNYNTYIFGNIHSRNPHDFNKDGYSELTKIRTSTLGIKNNFNINDKIITLELVNIRDFKRGGSMNMEIPDNLSLLSESVTSNLYLGGASLEGKYFDDFKYSYYFNFQDNYITPFYGGRDSITSEPDWKGYCLLRSTVYLAGSEHNFITDNFITGKSNFTFGVNYKHDFLKDSKPGYNILINQNVNNIDFYLQDIWDINDNLSIILGLRGDFYNIKYIDDKKTGFYTTPRMNLKYNLGEYIFKLGYSRGARAPQIYGESIHSEVSGGLITQILLSKDIKQENSNSFSGSIIFSPLIDDFNLEFSIDGFYNIIENPFISEESNIPSLHTRNIIFKNGSGAEAIGFSFEGKINYIDKYILQLNTTLQNNKYKDAVKWSNDIEGTRFFLRTPNIYGGAIFTYKYSENFDLNISGNYTGRQYIPHYSGYVANDKLEHVNDFFDFNFKITYNTSLLNNLNTTLSFSVNNIFNTYQKDLDRTNLRDANYIYGPSNPRIFSIGLKISYE